VVILYFTLNPLILITVVAVLRNGGRVANEVHAWLMQHAMWCSEQPSAGRERLLLNAPARSTPSHEVTRTVVHSRQHLARLTLAFDVNFSHCHSHNLPCTNWYSNFVSFSILFLADSTADRLPIDLLREELYNKLFVVWPQGDWIGSRI